jgi:repressor LexA
MGRPTPTPRQRVVMEMVKALSDLRGFPPTTRELMVALDIASPNAVNDHVKALVRKGLATREPLLSRSLKLTPKGVDYLAQETS